MNRTFYNAVALLTAVYATIILFKSIIFLTVGRELSNLTSFTGWFTFELLVWWVWSVVLLKYYHAKNYQFAFRTLAIAVVAYIIHFFASLKLLRTREITDYYILALLISLAANIVYAISLIKSDTAKKPWLKTAGILLLIQDTLLFVSIVWALNSTSFGLSGRFAIVEQWLSLAGCLIPVAFIIHFNSEKQAKPEEYIAGQEPWVSSINSITFFIFLGALYFGSNMVFEHIKLKNNPKQADENLKKIAEPYEAGFYVNSNKDTLQYRLLKPLNYDSTKQYPLVVCLHGSSGCGSDNAKQLLACLPVSLLATPDNRAKHPVFLFVPQCPAGSSWGGIANTPAIDSLVFGAINELQQKFPLDTNRYYITGNSLGGYGAWHFISTRPDMFAAAIPISGAGDASLAHQIKIPVWAFHGAKDRNVLAIGSRTMIEGMRKAGEKPTYTEYPDKAHGIWEQVKETPGLLDWLFAQKRTDK